MDVGGTAIDKKSGWAADNSGTDTEDGGRKLSLRHKGGMEEVWFLKSWCPVLPFVPFAHNRVLFSWLLFVAQV